MIDDKTKNELLKEIEKNGNVSLSCLKLGIDKSTYYRWLKNKSFKKKADEAVKRGRQGNCDVAESALMVLVKQKHLGAIKYMLGHNSPRYKQRITDYRFSYEKIQSPIPTQKTLEDLFDEARGKSQKSQDTNNSPTDTVDLESGKDMPPEDLLAN